MATRQAQTCRPAPLIGHASPPPVTCSISSPPRTAPPPWSGASDASAGRVLVVDEVGYLAYGARHADLLFEVVSRRYDVRKPIVITTNRPFREWNETFPNATCVVTLVDRLAHRSEIVTVKGKSYRLKESQEQSAAKKRAREVSG